MDEILNIRQWPHAKHHALSFHLTLLHLITISMVIGFSVLVIGTNAMARSTSAPPRPFTAFVDIFPEQSRDNVEKKGFYCLPSPNTPGLSEYCTLKLAAGAVARINAVISNRVVQQVQFMTRGNDVRLGDLMLFLGTPEFSGSGHLMFFFWPHSHVIASALSDAPPSPFLPLQTVIITSPWEKTFG